MSDFRGVVTATGDGVARAYGLDAVESGELVKIKSNAETYEAALNESIKKVDSNMCFFKKVSSNMCFFKKVSSNMSFFKTLIKELVSLDIIITISLLAYGLISLALISVFGLCIASLLLTLCYVLVAFIYYYMLVESRATLWRLVLSGFIAVALVYGYIGIQLDPENLVRYLQDSEQGKVDSKVLESTKKIEGIESYYPYLQLLVAVSFGLCLVYLLYEYIVQDKVQNLAPLKEEASQSEDRRAAARDRLERIAASKIKPQKQAAACNEVLDIDNTTRSNKALVASSKRLSNDEAAKAISDLVYSERGSDVSKTTSESSSRADLDENLNKSRRKAFHNFNKSASSVDARFKAVGESLGESKETLSKDEKLEKLKRLQAESNVYKPSTLLSKKR